MRLKTVGILFLLLFIPLVAQAEEDQNVYYYILIDRFESGEQNGEGVNVDDPYAFNGGDFAGIENRVEHLETLGVSHVILSPIFESNDYTGFEVSTYEGIQPTFGSQKDLEKLINSLNDHDIEVILHFPIDQQVEEDVLIDYMTHWEEELPISGYYFSNTDDYALDFWEQVTSAVNGFTIGERRDGQLETLLETGFDRVFDRSAQDEAVEFFKDMDQPLEPLMDATDWKNEQIIYSMDFYDSNRFTHIFSQTNSHQITHWKLALTYLMTTSSEPLIYQGSEIPLDGVVEDGSHHQMMNFLAGEDQLIRHIEKIANAYDDLPSLSKGQMDILHADDSFLVFKKTYEDETTIVAINNSSTQQRVNVDLESNLELRGLLVDDLIRENDDGTYSVAAERESSNIFMVQDDTGVYWPLIFIFVGIMTIFVVFSILMYRKNKN
ncbi:alpha-amylase family glycosyl hydrolase [Aquisalibacillus elongatus]|uniref:Alpha amylase catalytic subunit n=1 Tax=Aquisalibacillus elongatus TaxID=485577 RepID=A0A3N5BY29_9BACI|nr:alpha-amylase family glycosyl hydrolase [Aquisalibacillus elongatus]RPF52072.1 alpha amylase catalytic subunit [Aquisalibacillus elongatus]